MRVLDLFAGYGGFSLAAHRSGMETVAFSEIEPFACKLLTYRWPNIPNLGDIREINGADIAADIVTAGFPCQDLSVAGKRAGLAGGRSGLFWEIVRIVREMKEAGHGPAWVVLENVPGLLSSNGGRDFAAILRGLAELGPMDIAWRVLDAQFFGVPQRRRRVFIVVDFGGERAAQVLFEPEGVRGHSAPRRTPRQGASSDVAGSLGVGSGQRGWCDDLDRATFIPAVWPEVVGALTDGAHYGGGLNRQDAYTGRIIPVARDAKGPRNYQDGGLQNAVVTHSLTRTMSGATEDGTGRGTPLVPVATFDNRQVTCPTHRGTPTPNICHTLHSDAPVAFHLTQDPISGDIAPAMGTDNRQGCATVGTQTAAGVRRLTPLECERLQGLPPAWTDIPGASDSARYRAIGNGVAVPCVEWILRRLSEVA